MTEHYFTRHPSPAGPRREIRVSLAGREFTLATAGGVFSPDRVDRGTAVLLDALARNDEPLPPGDVLDLGCGWGPIALSAGLRYPERKIWAVDVNTRARELAAENARRVGLSQITVCEPHEVPTDLRFAALLSNPPIRVGKSVLHDMMRTWIPRLLPGGTAQLVVAKHLGADSLLRYLRETFPEFEVSRAAREKGFHLIRATRRRG